MRFLKFDYLNLLTKMFNTKHYVRLLLLEIKKIMDANKQSHNTRKSRTTITHTEIRKVSKKKCYEM